MIFGKRKHKFPKFPQTYEEINAATRKVAAFITTDIKTDITDSAANNEENLLLIVYENGFLQIKFTSGTTAGAQFPDVETAIQGGCALAETSAGNSCRFPSIEVHRRPARTNELNWMHSIGIAVRHPKPDGTWTDWE